MSLIWLVILANAAVPPPIDGTPAASARSGAISPSPRGNPGEWITTSDYPSSALRMAKEGAVGFRLTVSPEGRVSDCTVTVSSGTVDLDDATCRLVAARALFHPATDANGAAIAGTYHSRVLWRIPQGMPPPAAGVFAITFVVETDGSQSDCRVVQSTAPPGRRPPVGPAPCLQRLFKPAFTDAAGNPVRKRVTVTETTMTEDIKD